MNKLDNRHYKNETHRVKNSEQNFTEIGIMLEILMNI